MLTNFVYKHYNQWSVLNYNGLYLECKYEHNMVKYNKYNIVLNVHYLAL